MYHRTVHGQNNGTVRPLPRRSLRQIREEETKTLESSFSPIRRVTNTVQYVRSRRIALELASDPLIPSRSPPTHTHSSPAFEELDTKHPSRGPSLKTESGQGSLPTWLRTFHGPQRNRLDKRESGAYGIRGVRSYLASRTRIGWCLRYVRHPELENELSSIISTTRNHEMPYAHHRYLKVGPHETNYPTFHND